MVTIQYKGRWQWEWRNRRAEVGLNPAVPWDIELVGGASKVQGKLNTVDVRSFELTGGADQLRLTLGRPAGDVPIRLSGGGNNVRIERPAGTAVGLELTGGAGKVELDGRKLGAVAGRSLLESSGAAGASTRHRVEIIGGAAKIAIVETDA